MKSLGKFGAFLSYEMFFSHEAYTLQSPVASSAADLM